MIISAWWLRTSSKLTKKSKEQPVNSEMESSYKRMQIRPKFRRVATVAFSWHEDKDETKQTNVMKGCDRGRSSIETAELQLPKLFQSYFLFCVTMHTLLVKTKIQKTCKQNSFRVGVVWQTQSIV